MFGRWINRPVTGDQYGQHRDRLANQIGPQNIWSVADQWPLYCASEVFARSLANIEIVKSTLDVPGDIAEFGSWFGANLMLMAKCIRTWDPNSAKLVHGFDSFQGLTQFEPQDIGTDTADQMRGSYRGSPEVLRQMAELEAMTGEIALHVGLIEETLPAFIEKNPQASFSVIYCDTDLYSSTKLILDTLHEHLMPGGVFVLDEWNSPLYPGEGVAAREFLNVHGDKYKVEHVRNAQQPNLLLRKLSMQH